MDGNVPELVVLSYENFSQMQQPAQTTQKSPEMPPEVPVHQHPTHADLIASQTSQREEELIDALNKEILGLKEEIRQKETADLIAEETTMS